MRRRPSAGASYVTPSSIQYLERRPRERFRISFFISTKNSFDALNASESIGQGLIWRTCSGGWKTYFIANPKHEILTGNQGIRKSGCRIPGIRISGKVKNYRIIKPDTLIS